MISGDPEVQGAQARLDAALRRHGALEAELEGLLAHYSRQIDQRSAAEKLLHGGGDAEHMARADYLGRAEVLGHERNAWRQAVELGQKQLQEQRSRMAQRIAESFGPTRKEMLLSRLRALVVLAKLVTEETEMVGRLRAAGLEAVPEVFHCNLRDAFVQQSPLHQYCAELIRRGVLTAEELPPELTAAWAADEQRQTELNRREAAAWGRR